MAHLRHSTKEKVDKCACNMVKMERGEYEWPDGKQHWSRDANGNRIPRVVQTEAMRQAWDIGSSEQVSHSMYTKVFEEKGIYHHYLLERIAYHRQRLSDGYQQALAKLTDDGEALTIMSNKLYESLWWDLNDEDTRQKIPFRERARFFEVLTKMNASIKGDVASQGTKKLPISTVVNVINVPDSVKERMMSNIEGEAEEEPLENEDLGL